MRNLQICTWRPWTAIFEPDVHAITNGIIVDNENDLVILSNEAAQIQAISADKGEVCSAAQVSGQAAKAA